MNKQIVIRLLTSNYKKIPENSSFRANELDRTADPKQFVPTTYSDIDISRFIDGRLPANGDLMVSMLHGTPDRAVRVRALVGVFVFCSWTGHFTLTVPLSTWCVNGC